MSEKSLTNNTSSQRDPDSLEKQAADYLAGWQRAKADYANLKKETDERLAQLAKYANEELLKELLPLVDYFKSALRAVPKEELGSGWVEGVRHIQTRLLEIMAYNGVKEMDVIGEVFNPELHEAVEQVTDGGKPGNIVAEVRTGFYLHDKVLQPARVKVAK